ncbi:MAG: hypothetical protein R3C10_19000 [Pirellulales bacterium]
MEIREETVVVTILQEVGLLAGVHFDLCLSFLDPLYAGGLEVALHHLVCLAFLAAGNFS